MNKKDLILAIWEANPSLGEPAELLKRLDAQDDFSGVTKDINGTRLAKLCRAALEIESLTGEAKAEAEKMAALLDTAGGYREGAGRKPSGKKAVSFYITDAENELLRAYLENLRSKSV